MNLNERLSFKAINSLQPRQNGGGAGKFEKDQKSIVRQLQNGVPIEQMGARVFRLLRMSPELYRMNGDTHQIKEQLGINGAERVPHESYLAALYAGMADERARVSDCVSDEEKYLSASEEVESANAKAYPRVKIL